MPEGSQNGPAWEEQDPPGAQGDEPLAAVALPPGGDAEGDPLVVVAEPGSAGQPQQLVFSTVATCTRQCRCGNAS